MINVVLIFCFWVLTLFLNFLGNAFSPGFFSFEIFLVFPFFFIRFTKKDYSLLVMLLFGLTADAFVVNFPGLISFSFLLVGYFFYLYQSKLFIEGKFNFMLFFLLNVLGVKVFDYLVVYVLSGNNLFGWFLEGNFWFGILFSLFYCWVLFPLFPFFKQKFRAFL